MGNIVTQHIRDDIRRCADVDGVVKAARIAHQLNARDTWLLRAE